jgi:tetratricopeptide (TPR) repeat protein
MNRNHNMHKRNFCTLFLLLVHWSGSNAQQNTIDSLKNALNNAAHDTTRCFLMNELIDLTEEAESEKYVSQLEQLCESKLRSTSNKKEILVYKKHLGNVLTSIAIMQSRSGQLNKTMETLKRGMALRKEINDEEGLAESLNNLGYFYKIQGNIPMALDHYSKSLSIQEKINDRAAMAFSLMNLAAIYASQGDFYKTEESYIKARKINEDLGNERGVAQVLMNLATLQAKVNKLDSAYLNFKKCYEVFSKINDKHAMATAVNSLGYVLFHMNRHDEAHEMYLQALKISEETKDVAAQLESFQSLGDFMYNKGKHILALGYAKKSMELSRIGNFPENIENASRLLYRVYKAIGKDKEALENYELMILMRDSVDNETNRRASLKTQMKYEYEKQAAKDSVAHAKETEIANAELAKQKAEIKAKKNQQYALFGGLGLVMIFAGFMYNRFKITQKQKVIIEQKELETQKQNKVISHQKHLVEEKQKEILDSIHYAKRIQSALITNEKSILRSLERLRKDPS